MNQVLNFKKKLTTNYTLPIAIFIASMFISIMFAPQYKYMEEVFNTLNFETTQINAVLDVIKVSTVQLIVIFVIFSTVETIDDIKFYLKSFVVSIFAINFIGLAFFNSSVVSDRFRSILTDANVLGRFEGFIIIILVGYLLFFKKEFFKTVFSVFYILLCFGITFLTLSRGAMATCFIAILIMFLFNKSKLLKILMITISVLLVPILFALIGTFRIGTGTGGGIIGSFVDVSNASRLALNIAAWNMFLDYPIFGVGYWNFYNMYINHLYVPEGIPVFLKVAIVHSWFFSPIAEQGLLGMISLTWVMYLLMRDNLRAIKSSVDIQFKGIGVILFCLMFIIIFFGLNYPSFVPEISFALIAGLIAAYIKLSQNLIKN